MTLHDNFIENASTLRVAQLNILNSEEGEEYRYRFLSHWMNAISPDIISLQEVRDPSIAEEALTTSGFNDFIWSRSVSAKGVVDHTGIASKKQLVGKRTIEFTHRPAGINPMSMGALSVPGGLFYLVSAHLTWKMTNEHQRLSQASEISSLADELVLGTADQDGESAGGDNVFMLGSDMNADETSRTIRYMKGLDFGHNNDDTAHWIDAYDFVKPEDKEKLWATTDQGNSYWGQRTAAKHGIVFAQMLPLRRINYLFSYGWCYGKRGCPTNYQRFGEPDPQQGFDYDLSDHYGIYSDILI